MAVAMYVPILKWKQGEWQALGGLAEDVRESVLPLMELVPSTESADTVRDHVSARVGRLASRWSREVLIDVALLVEYDGAEPGDVFAWLVEDCEDVDLTCVPAVPLWDSDFAESAADAVSRLGRAGLRLSRTDMLLADLEQRVDSLLRAFGLDADAVDVVLDMGSEVSPVDARSMLGRLPRPTAWRSVTLAGGAFARPQGAGSFVVPREHLDVWREVRADLDRPVGFGDYAAIEPEYTHLTGYVEVVPQLVYTRDADWFVVRGRRVSIHGWEQTADLARRVADLREFAGPDFSEGDRWIAERARGGGTSGNSMKLVEVKTSHHISHVVRRDLAIRSES